VEDIFVRVVDDLQRSGLYEVLIWQIILRSYIKIQKANLEFHFRIFLGCITTGTNIDDAKDMAQEAL